MITLRFSGNISAEATTQFGNILPEAMRGIMRAEANRCREHLPLDSAFIVATIKRANRV